MKFYRFIFMGIFCLTLLLGLNAVLAQDNTQTGTIDDVNWYIRYDLGQLNAGDYLIVNTEVTSGDIGLYLNLWEQGVDTPLSFGNSLTYEIAVTNFYTLDVVRASGTTGTYTITYRVGDAPVGDSNNAQSLDIEAVLAQGCTIGPVPATLGLDPFYEKYCDLGGIPVIGSGDIPDIALQQAWYTAANMLSASPDSLQFFKQFDIRIGVIGINEVTTTMPEYADFYEAFPGTDWDTRGRGFGATIARPLVSGAEENLLCYVQDVYRGENIFVHEFSHTLKDFGINRVDLNFQSQLQALYDSAMAEGRWVGTYAATNPEEYWAEGVQSYFNVNINMPANTRTELQSYDPQFFALLDGVFGGSTWQPSCGCTATLNNTAVYTEPDHESSSTISTGTELIIESHDADWLHTASGTWIQMDDVRLTGSCAAFSS